VAWRLVDAVHPASRFDEAVRQRARELAESSDRPADAAGIALGPLHAEVAGSGITYSAVSLALDPARRTATLTVRAPEGPQPSTPEEIVRAGDAYWPLRAFRELDDALLRLRFNEPSIGAVLVRTTGDPDAVLAVDRTLAEHREHWLVREILLLMKRTLKRMDLTAKTFFALIEPGSAFAGSLFELALAADRSYMLDDPEGANRIHLSPLNGGPLPMSNGLPRLQVRFLAEPDSAAALLARGGGFGAAEAEEAGLVSFAPDDIDWDDEVRLAVEARTAFSPDAMTGLEANLRFAGPETMETKIFGRLTAWQNWIFQRPNAVGATGALTSYGHQGRAEFDWTRT
jgi:benzoyl-CoA-dihydrodiol lyase